MAWESIDSEILAYLAGDMTTAEHEAFEERLKQDAALAETLAAQKKLNSQLSGYFRREKYEDEVAALQKKFRDESKGGVLKPWMYIAAAAIVALILTFIFLLPEGKQYCPEELYAETLIIPEAPQTAGAEETVAQRSLAQGHFLFNEKQYQQAIPMYQTALDSIGLNRFERAQAQLFMGQSNMNLSDFDAAIANFNEIEEGAYSMEATWYLALAYLAKEEIDRSKVILDEIRKDASHDRFDEASALLKKWGKLKACP